MSLENKYDFKVRCDIVLHVYRNYVCVKECIESIIKYSPNEIYDFYLIDHCSDTKTEEYLKSIKNNYNNVIIIRNSTNKKYLKKVNNEILPGKSEYILLIEDHVMVVEGWLERMLACADSDSSIAVVNPLSDTISSINISLPPGINFMSMDRAVHQNSLRKYPDIFENVSYCMLMRRSVFDGVIKNKLNVHQNNLSETLKLCILLRSEGYRAVVADDVYIYCNKRSYFIKKDKRRIFDKNNLGMQFRKKYRVLCKTYKKVNQLDYLRNKFKLSKRWAPTGCMRETYRIMRSKYRKGNFLGVFKSALNGLFMLPFSRENIVTKEYISKFCMSGHLRVTYVLNKINVAGGVISVFQLVNELILLGVDARIVALYQYPETKNWKQYVKPIIYKNPVEMVSNFPDSDIIIATHWSTVNWVSKIVELQKSAVSVYFIQDYESWFFPKSDVKSREKVKSSYQFIENKIVKSSWLQKLLIADGYQSTKIWIGMDLGVFYPRDFEKNDKITILAMARPGTERRGFTTLISALSILLKNKSNLEIILFGEDLSSYTVPFDYLDKGPIFDSSELAELYSFSDIFIDSSDFQGFGRTALEAMACNAACVLTDAGGVMEYAKDGYNCLLVKPKKPEDVASAVIRLIDDNILKEKIVQGGVSTVKHFSHKEEAKKTLNYFNSLIN